MRSFAVTALFVLPLLSGGLVAQSYAPSRSDLPERVLNGRLNAPQGYTVETFATLAHPRLMAVGPNGVVYVSQPSSGQVTRLVDADGNGVAETQDVVASGLDRPHGLAVKDGWLYVANSGSVVRVKLDAAGKSTGSLEKIAEFSSGGGHWSRTVIFGPDGKMYVAIGSTCNICEEKSDERAAVLRFDADGSNRHLFAKGLRNAVGMAVHPRTGEIWVTQNERDNLEPEHEDLPPEEINILKDGSDYGWPYCHSDGVPNPEYKDTKRCPGTVPPALKMQAHSAPLGITFLDRATKLPADVRGDALVAFHGSWNRNAPTGAKVVRIRVKDGKPTGYEDFLTGWQEANGKRWGRPVDVLVHADGSVLISDDQAGVIYRVFK
ncbi:MAG: PQQ-dependent sugar dehydrogenase [Gemmatimonadaceae bacterium]